MIRGGRRIYTPRISQQSPHTSPAQDESIQLLAIEDIQTYSRLVDRYRVLVLAVLVKWKVVTDQRDDKKKSKPDKKKTPPKPEPPKPEPGREGGREPREPRKPKATGI